MHTNWRDCQEWRRHGLPMSTTCNEAAKLYDAALTQLLSYRDIPGMGGLNTTLGKLMAADPQWVLGHAVKIGLEMVSAERVLGSDPTLQADLDTMMELCKRPEVHAWERMHAEAVVHWAKGYKSRSCSTYEEILLNHPRDMLSVQFAHIAYLYLGNKIHHRQLAGRILLDWDKDMPHYGYLLALHSFGLADSHSLYEAEIYAQKALELDRYNCMATHTLAHVFHHSGRHTEGATFMRTTEKDWQPSSHLARHNYWHLALFDVANGNHEMALDIYDQEVHTRLRNRPVFGVIENSSLLKELEFQGVDVGDRWQDVYEVARPLVGQHLITASDLSIMSSCLGAGKLDEAHQLMESVETFMREGHGDNHAFMKACGHDLLKSWLAYGEGDYGKAIDILYPIRHEAQAMGGSELESDILNIFLINAGLRSDQSRHHKLAKCLVSERCFGPEESPMIQRWMQRVLDYHED